MRCDYLRSKILTFTLHVMAAKLFTPEKFPSYFWNFPKQTVEKLCSIYTFLDKENLCLHELSSIHSAEEFRSMSEAMGLFDFIVQNSLEKTFSESSEFLKLILSISITVTRISSHEKLRQTIKFYSQYYSYDIFLSSLKIVTD